MFNNIQHSIKSKTVAVAFLAVVMAATIVSCLKNDIPYPHIQVEFADIVAVGQSQGAKIDPSSRTVTLFFPEEVDLFNVQIESYELSPADGRIVSGGFDEPIDLSVPHQVVLGLYQDYTWTINAVQNIERYFEVENQIGASTIDVPGRRVVAYVYGQTNLESLLVKRIKLGPEGSTMNPDLEGKYVDFSEPIVVNVTAYGVTQRWDIYIETKESTVAINNIDAWTNVAWVYAEALEGRNNGMQYRMQGDTEWLDVPAEWITTSGGSYYARLVHLSPLTTYEVRPYSDQEYGMVHTFTTEGVYQMPNSDFDSWWLNGKVWNPWAEGSTPYWDTGNKGATTLGPSNVTPTEETVSGQGWAARLETRFVGVGLLGKLASGSIFAGSFVRADGTNGILSFGREYNLHPTHLTGYLKYKTATINYAQAEMADLKGRPDTCIVWIALIDTPEPFEIRTNPKNRQLFDPDGDYVVAYGKVQYGYDINEYIPFNIELNYKDTKRTPKYILVTASASKYGDYFTGGNGAVLYLDDFKLTYDYEH